jgi:glutamate-1-semialdehyde 2,1-aminomutase
MAFHASSSTGDEPVSSYGRLKQRDSARYARLADALIDLGVWVARRGIWYVSAARTEADVTETVERVNAAIKAFTAAEL